MEEGEASLNCVTECHEADAIPLTDETSVNLLSVCKMNKGTRGPLWDCSFWYINVHLIIT